MIVNDMDEKLKLTAPYGPVELFNETIFSAISFAIR